MYTCMRQAWPDTSKGVCWFPELFTHVWRSIRRANGPRRVRTSFSILDHFSLVCSLIIGRWPGGPDPPEACMRPPTLHLFSTLEAPRFDFYRFSDPPNRHRKSKFLRTLKNRPRWINQSTLLRPRNGFLLKNKTSGVPFGFHFCLMKWQKCQISEAYNAKRGSEPLNTLCFRIDFSLHFHFFGDSTFWGHFGRV